MASTKEQAVINFLMTCPSVANNPLFFNFIKAKENNKQIITLANEKSLNTPYIDGSVLKRYTFTVVDFKSVAYNALITITEGTTEERTNESVEEYLDVQGIIDWVDEQAEARNFPDFGADCDVQEMRVLTDNPNLNGVDTGTKPALAKYSFSIQIDYLDTSKSLWNK